MRDTIEITGYTRCRVVLTQAGVDMLNDNDAKLIGTLSDRAWQFRDRIIAGVRARKAGMEYETELWTLMSDFGPHVHLGCYVPFHSIVLNPPTKIDHMAALKRRMYHAA
jgi:hypothetical protein